MTTDTLTDLAQTIFSAQAALRAAEDIMQNSGDSSANADEAREYLSSTPMYQAVEAVPDCLQEYIVEECLRNGSIDVDEVLDNLGASNVVDRLTERGELSGPTAEALAEIAGRIRDLRYADLEDVIDEANEIANALENLI